MLDFQSLIVSSFIPYAYKEGDKPLLPSIGDDYSKVYGYAEDHKAVEEELLKWLAQTEDILQNGTPPPWVRCTDFPSHFWNKLIGFVDLPQKVIKGKRAVRGPDSKPGSLMWLNMFGYILFQAWRKYQDSRIIHLLDGFKSFRELETSQANVITFNAFLYRLCKGDDKMTAQLI